MVKHLAALTAFCAMIVGLVGYVGSLGIRVAPPANRTNLSMNVSNVNNLVVDSNVLLRGVPVGKVDGIDASLAHATIHFTSTTPTKCPSTALCAWKISLPWASPTSSWNPAAPADPSSAMGR